MKTKYIVVNSFGELPMLGGISGPITTPFEADIHAVIAMMNSGKKVYEVNKSNPTQRVLLTRENVLKDNFKTNRNKAIAQKKAYIKSQIATKTSAVKNKVESAKETPKAEIHDDSADNFGKIGATDGFESNIASGSEKERV
jgi:hypothetical protein